MAGELVLGPVTFEAFEVPETIRFGGRQRLAVHLLPGGGRVVDVMGADEGPVVWCGVFSGQRAGARVRALEALRRDGAVLDLRWDGWRYTVVIEAFDVQEMNPAWMPYQVRLCVVTASDVATDEGAPDAATAAEIAALSGGADLDSGIPAASAALLGTDIATAIAASGTLARLVTARALGGGG